MAISFFFFCIYSGCLPFRARILLFPLEKLLVESVPRPSKLRTPRKNPKNIKPATKNKMCFLALRCFLPIPCHHVIG